MAKIDDDKLIAVLIKQRLIEQEEAQACIEYQKKHLKQRGKEISLPDTLEKLDILPASKLDSFIRAIESSSVTDSAPVFTSEGKVEKDEDSPRISRAVLGGMGKSKKFSIKPELTEGVNHVEIPQEQGSSKINKPVSLFAVNQEKKLSAEPKGPLKPAIKVNEPPKTEPQKQEVEIPEVVEETGKKDISVATAYILLIFLGFLGVHRYYLKRDRSAILYSMTLGFFFVGVIVDLFLLPFMVIKFQKEGGGESYLDSIEENPTPNGDLPQWAIAKSGLDRFKSFLEFNIQILLALFIPIVLMSICLITEETWVAIAMVVLMVLLLLHNFYQKTSLALEYIPLFSFTNKVNMQLKSMYFYKKPVPSIFYILYPIWAPIAFLKSQEKTKEAMLYAGFIATSIFTATIFFIYQLTSLSVEQAKVFALDHFLSSFVVVFLTVGLFITFITIVCRWQIGRKQAIAQASSGWGVVIAAMTILTLCGALFEGQYCFYHKEKAKLELRLSSQEFRDQLKAICSSYLKYIVKEHPQWSQQKKQQVLREFLGGIVTPKELALFQVRFHKESDISELTWVDSSLQAIVGHDKYSLVNKWDSLNSSYREVIMKEKEKKKNFMKAIHSFLYQGSTKKEGFIEDFSEKK